MRPNVLTQLREEFPEWRFGSFWATAASGAEPPFTWVTPGLIRPGDPAPARGRALLWAREHRPFPCITLRQDDRVIARQRVPWPVARGGCSTCPGICSAR